MPAAKSAVAKSAVTPRPKAAPKKRAPKAKAAPKRTPKATPKRKAEPKATPKSEALDANTVREMVAAYVKAHGSTAIDAAWKGDPFVHNGRVYFQAVGRAKSGGLAGFLGTAAPSHGKLAAALRDAGFVRQPFPARDPDTGKQTGRSHYSAPVDSLDVTLGERATARRERVARKAQVVKPKASADTIRAKATDADRRKLADADAALNAAMDAVSAAKGKAKEKALDAAREASADRAKVYAAVAS